MQSNEIDRKEIYKLGLTLTAELNLEPAQRKSHRFSIFGEWHGAAVLSCQFGTIFTLRRSGGGASLANIKWFEAIACLALVDCESVMAP